MWSKRYDHFFLDLMPRVYSTYVSFFPEKRCDSWNPSGCVPTILYRKWGVLIPSNLDPTKVWVLPKVWKGPKGHELRCNGCNSRVGPQADSLKEIQKIFSKNWVIFPTTNAWGKVGPEAYGNWNLSHPHLFFLIFFKMSNPKTPRTFRQEIGVSRLTWKLSKRFSLVMFAQCRVAQTPGGGSV